MTLTVTEAGLALADPALYADEARLHESLTLLRRKAPVHRVRAPGFEPFLAITRHGDIMEIERQNSLFLNAPRPLLATVEMDAIAKQHEAEGTALRTLIHMDDPQHRVVRAIGADWFRPRAMRALQVRVTELARHYVDRMAEAGGECDFATQIAAHYPLYVILSLLGLPESDFGQMLILTQEIFGGQDPERQRSADPGTALDAVIDMMAYFTRLTEARRAHPTEDIASAIANARIDGELLSDTDASSYYVIIATAGHDTTSATIAGGLSALIEHQDQLDQLRAQPELMASAAEEMIRWVSPVKEFMRTATEDYELRGKVIGKGESLLLCYPSANRDEEVFRDPFTFDVGRSPNRHLAFGSGVHYCLGVALARLEITALFRELIATTFVGGLKHLPIAYELS
jgi:cytochrome P450